MMLFDSNVLFYLYWHSIFLYGISETAQEHVSIEDGCQLKLTNDFDFEGIWYLFL